MPAPSAPSGRPLTHPANRAWALGFEALNTCSWSAVLGAPMALLLLGQGASATILGIALALPPLTMALQLYGARLLPRFGHRGLMVRGWNLRTVVVGGIAATAAAAPWLGPGCTIAAILALLAVFTVLRGITTCAWMPWTIQLIPASGRGRYLAAAALIMQVVLAACNLGYGAWLDHHPGAGGFVGVFAFACLTGFATAWVMTRIPDAPVEADGASEPISWRRMLDLPAFAGLLRFSLLASLAVAALSVLWVPVLRDLHHQGDGMIATVPVWACAAQLAVLPLLGRVVDRTGSRPMLAMAMAALCAQAVLWALLAANHLPPATPTLAAIQIAAGIGTAAFLVASQRLLMAIVPEQGRSHFFALYSAVTALGLGLAPVAWGFALDRIAGWHAAPLGWELNGHALLFLLAAALLAAGVAGALRLSEPHAMSASGFLHELLVRTPGRTLVRLTALVDGR